MKRIGLVVAYDGTNYSGWQIQPNGVTIQGVLNDTLTELLGEKIEIMGASRTDAGVHLPHRLLSVDFWELVLQPVCVLVLPVLYTAMRLDGELLR